MDENVNNTVKLILEHSNHIGSMDTDTSNIVDEKLMRIRQEIEKGLEDGTIVPEMADIINEIDEIKKDLHIGKIINQSLDTINTDISSDWVLVEHDDCVQNTTVERLSNRYKNVCAEINLIRKPIKPLFIILQWIITVYTTGFFSIIPILLKLLSQ